MKTKEQIKAYNKAYSARPEVIARAKVKNARSDQRSVRKLYKQTEASKKANLKYRRKPETKAKVKSRYLMNRYGIDSAQYQEMFKAQEGKCAICLKVTTGTMHVDHCHRTKKVRGLLCGSCNMALGLFDDSQQSLQKAIDYLNQV